MSILDRFRSAPRPEVKVFNQRELKSFPLYQMIPTFYGWTAKWSQYSNSQSLLAYKKSVWLYDCLTLRANNIAGVPWVVQLQKGKEWEETDSHPLVDLLAHPNPDYDLPTMMMYVMYWLDLTGDAWGTKVRNGAKEVYQWWPLLPDTMEVIQGRNSMVEGWKYRMGGKSMPNITAQDIMHFRYVDPSSPYYGLSPLQSAAKAIDIDMEASNFQKVTLQNNGMPPGIFIEPDTTTQEQHEQNEKYISEHSGPEYAQRAWVGNLDYKSMGNNPKELDFNESRKMTRVEICSAYGVPLPLVGVYDDATLANIQTARRIFWMETLIPVLRKLEGQLNLQLASEFGPGVRITYDLSRVEALQEDMNLKITAARELWSMGVPLDQVNTVMDMGLDTDKIEGADVGYLPSGLLPANFDAGEPDPMSSSDAAVTYEGGKGPAAPAAASGPVAPAPDTPVANTAMNGTQVTALQGIVQAVADGDMPSEAALQLILVAFPSITAAQGQAIIRPMDGFEKTKPDPEPNPFAKPAAVPPVGKPGDVPPTDGDNA